MKLSMPRLTVAFVIMSITFFFLAPASAESPPGHCGLNVCIDTGDGVLNAGSLERYDGGYIAHNAPDPIYRYRLVTPCISEDPVIGGCLVRPDCPAPPDRNVQNFLVQSQVIADGVGSPWSDLGISCVDITELEPTVTPEMVLAAFRELPLPLGEVSFQPVSGTILVNVGAIFYTTQPETAAYDIVLLDQAVRIDATISDYAWHPGDGSPDIHGRGAPYPDQSTRHIYTHSGPIEVSLTLTWSATYTVDGGPQETVPGTTTTDSPSSTLDIVEAHAVLVDSFD